MTHFEKYEMTQERRKHHRKALESKDEFEAIDYGIQPANTRDEMKAVIEKYMASIRAYNHVSYIKMYGDQGGPSLASYTLPARHEILGKNYIDTFIVFCRVFGSKSADTIAKMSNFNLEYECTLQNKLSLLLASKYREIKEIDGNVPLLSDVQENCITRRFINYSPYVYYVKIGHTRDTERPEDPNVKVILLT